MPTASGSRRCWLTRSCCIWTRWRGRVSPTWPRRSRMSDAVTARTEPRGVIAIFTAPDGDVIATAADFSRSGMGGCKLWEAQLYRVRDAVKWKAVQAYCSPALSDALSKYLLEQIADAMCGKG